MFLVQQTTRKRDMIAHRVNIYVGFRVGDQYAAFEKQKTTCHRLRYVLYRTCPLYHYSNIIASV